MRIKMKSKIISVLRLSNEVKVDLEFAGFVQDTKLINAKEAKMVGSLCLKPAMADQLKLGSVITVVLSDEDEEANT